MKREIKFRAWARTGEWDDDGEKRKFEMIPADSLMIFEDLLKDGLKDVDDEYYVMQFTGLHDKNGKEIYEGDIVNIETISLTPREVRFINGAFKYVMKNITYRMDEYDSNEINIIGNIYENPDLL